MTPYYADDWLTVWQGDCREVMAAMEPESVHCVVSSPPYWGLRDYGIGGQLGLEPTPEEYVANMVAVFREVRRVLRSDGSVWLNLGDSYISGQGGRQSAAGSCRGTIRQDRPTPKARPELENAPSGWAERAVTPRTYPGADNAYGWKPKDLAGIPWRVAFALQADGWYLRSDIIWSKPNPMPESVTDRPTKAHEYLFLLSKSPRYYYDAAGVAEPVTESTVARLSQVTLADQIGSTRANGGGKTNGNMKAVPPRFGGSKYGDDDSEQHRTKSGNEYTGGTHRNLRSVWSIATQPYPGAHFATFPEKLVEPCVKAGTSERGVCPDCGTPWKRLTSVEYVKSPVHGAGSVIGRHEETGANGWDGAGMPRLNKEVTTTGWQPDCICLRAWEAVSETMVDMATVGRRPDPVPATVLDPFAGSGTTGRVAQRLGRRAVLIDLNADYLVQAMARNRDIPLGLESA